MCSCVELIREQKIQHSQKDRECQACEWISNSIDKWGNPFTFAEWRAIVKAWRSNWMIRKGEPYVLQVLKNSDDFWTFKAIPEIHAICLKYDIYPCDC